MDVQILGTRGVPASHGGFESFAEALAVYLTKRGHSVTVYCQSDSPGPPKEDLWKGIRRVHLYGAPGPLGTVRFDWAATRRSAKAPGIPLVLGYNSAILSFLYVLKGRKTIMNMDGIEWKRDKWSFPQKIWLLLNEFLGARLSTHLVADHPEIARHLQRHTSKRKITTIAYGADELPPAGDATVEECSVLAKLGILPRGYMIVIARPEPENSLLEIVQAFSRQPRNVKLVVLGRLAPESNPYHRRVMETAGTNVLFPGAIFDKTIVGTLRRFACAYIHGHTVGGTNPSLVEALAAGSAVIAKDTAFNRWVAGPRAAYFDSVPQLSDLITDLLLDSDRLDSMRNASYIRFREAFRQEEILGKYMTLLEKFDSPPRYSEAREVLFQPTRLED